MDTESEEDPYQTDEDEEYLPSSDSEEEQDNNNVLGGIFPLDQPSTSYTNQHQSSTSRKTRKRQRRPSEWKVNKTKQLKTQGKEYVSNNKIRASKSMKPYQHTCRYKCINISEEQRLELFRAYYDLPSYDLQTAFLSSSIKKVEISRKKRDSSIDRKFSTHIFLLEKRVCKQFFLKTFDISNKRFATVCAKTNHLDAVEVDKRGKKQTHRRMVPENKNFVIKHIDSFPRYRSHYSRNENLETKYLSSDLNIKILYDLYKTACEKENRNPVKLSYYRFIFCNEFNLKFHRPHSDTCSRCDTYQNIIKYSEDEAKVSETKVLLTVHQRKAEKAVNCKKSDIEKYRLASDTVVVCFDLQQSLPTPLLTTSKVFYLRQLWTYNFCVYDLIKNQAHMFVWSEDIASRGSQEIGSCLIQFIKSLPPTIKRMIAYSDSCGGQNKNKNITKMFMFLVKATQLEEINHKFLEPGHTYMECDRSFGLIEKSKKKVPQVFVPNDWANIIRLTSKSFKVTNMSKENFYSFSCLNTLIGDPKKDVEKRSLNFRHIAYFQYSKNAETYSFKFKLTLDEDFPFSECIVPMLGLGRPSHDMQKVFCTILNEDPVNISIEKWKNLQSLLDYVPPRYHDYYKNLKHGTKKAVKPVEKTSKSKNATSQIASTATMDSESEADDDLAIMDSDYE